MTPEEMLLDLRDIHMPEPALDAAAGGFVLWPLALVVTVAFIAGWLAWHRRSTWRREVAQHLDAIERRVDEGEVLLGWTDLATLLRRIAISLCDRREIAGLIGDAWLKRLDGLFATDVFTQGHGRGLTIFPYSTADASDQDQQIAHQLRLTLNDVRKHLPNLKTAK